VSGGAPDSPLTYRPAGYRRDTRLSLELSKATTSSGAQGPEDPVFHAVEPEPTAGSPGKSRPPMKKGASQGTTRNGVTCFDSPCTTSTA
jgi:hypothetical protein